MKSLLIFILMFNSIQAYAWSNKPEGGLGYTSNANFEESNKKSDFYLWLRNYTSENFGKNSANLWVSYKDHFSESQYDAINWRAGFETPANIEGLRSWLWDFGLGGQHFTASNPGTTEEGFDFLYAEAALTKTMKLQPNLDFVMEPGYELKFFTDLDKRIDHRLYFNGLFDFTFNSKQTLSPYAEIGLVFSNESVFRKNYLELGLDWAYKLKTDLTAGAGLVLRTSAYVNRTLTTVTPISIKRRRSKSGAESQNEVQQYSQLQTYIAKMFKSFELKGTLEATSQNSKSGFEDYSEYGAKISVSTSF